MRPPIESRPVFGAHFKMGYSPRLDFELFGEYTSSSFEEIIAQNAFDTSWKELKLGFSATHTLLPSSSFVHPYVGGGFCMHRFTRKYSGEGGQSVPGDKSESAGCFHAIGGIKLKPAVMPFEFFVEGRYMFIGAEEEPTNFFSLVAGFSIFVLRK